MKKYIITTLVALTIILVGSQQASAGTLFPTHVPGETMYSLQEIYNLATASTTSSIGNGLPFNRPSSVNGSMVTLEELYNAVLALKNASSTDDGGGTINPPRIPVREQDGELNVHPSLDNPESATLKVEDAEKSGEHTIFAFDLEAEQSDIDIETVQIQVETGSANVSDVVSDFAIEIDGDIFDDWSFVEGASSTSAIVEFNVNGEYVLFIDHTVTVNLIAEFKAANGTNYNSPETIRAEIGNETIVGTDVDGVISQGVALGEGHDLEVTGILIDESEFSDNGSNQNNDEGTSRDFTFSFNVEAFEEDYYIATSSISIFIEGASSVDSFYTVDSTGDEDTEGVFTVSDGTTETFTVVVTLPSVETAGQYRVGLDSVAYTENSNGISGLFIKDVNNSDFRTAYATINLVN